MTEPSRWTEQTTRSLLLFSCLLFLLLTVGYLCGEGDFKIFYMANHQLFHHLNPYDRRLPTEGYPFGFLNSPLVFLCAAPISFFPFAKAVTAWTSVCVLLWTVSSALWIRMLWKAPIPFENVVRLMAASAIAPLYWALAAHQMTFQVLFFATLACWIASRKGSALWVGAATGGMLMKPHLVALLAIGLFFKSRRKLLFLSGTILALLLPFVPFMHTLRPPTDLRDWRQTLSQYRTDVFSADEQGLVARAVSTFRGTLAGRDIRHTGDFSGILIPTAIGQRLFMIKVIVWVIGVGLWGYVFYHRERSERTNLPKAEKHRIRVATPEGGETPSRCLSHLARATRVLRFSAFGSLSESEFFAITLSWGLLLSVYSHLYDAILVLPLVLLALREAAQRWRFSILFGICFGMNLIAGWTMLVVSSLHSVRWQIEGWASVAYILASAWILKRDKSS